MLHRSISPSLIQPPFINSNQTAQAGSPSHPRLNYEGKILEMMIFFRYSYKWLSMGSQGDHQGHPYMLRSATHAAICRGDPGGRPSINRPAIGLQLLSLLLALMSLLLFFPSVAHADGGAPNLAYI